MRLEVHRFSKTSRDTLGLLFFDGEFKCFTLEDEQRDEKVHGETRIPADTYRITLRKAGGLNRRYQVRFGQMHHGMLHLRNVPGFKWIYIHTGNRDAHTDGCLLVGDQLINNRLNPGGNNLLQSRSAYTRLYPRIAAAILRGEDCTIEIEDEDAQDDT